MNRRFFLRGLVAAPAVVAIGSLMPIRGIVMDVCPPGLVTIDPPIISVPIVHAIKALMAVMDLPPPFVFDDVKLREAVESCGLRLVSSPSGQTSKIAASFAWTTSTMNFRRR